MIQFLIKNAAYFLIPASQMWIIALKKSVMAIYQYVLASYRSNNWSKNQSADELTRE